MYQHKLIKMHAELATLNTCAVPFLSRAAVNLSWYYYTIYLNKGWSHIAPFSQLYLVKL